jgi:hypothetical protein
MNNILQEAAAIVNGEKQQQYGHPSVHYARVAAGWETIFADGIFDEEHIALAMVWFKMCRQLQAHKRDNIVDAIGYLLTVDMCREQKTELTRRLADIDRQSLNWMQAENLGHYKPSRDTDE